MKKHFIEALATGEDSGFVYCHGHGSVDCVGHWVYIRYSGLSLE